MGYWIVLKLTAGCGMKNGTSQVMYMYSQMLCRELRLKPHRTGINILTGAGWWNDSIKPKKVVGCGIEKDPQSIN